MSEEFNIGEKINPLKIGQRSFDPKELATALRRGAFWTVASWGAHAWTFHKDKMLRFMVQGRLFCGHVYIVLGWDDTFTLYFTTSRGTIKEKMEGIYVDVLVEVIDRYVETK
jgi:hypothetical protein